MLTVAWDNLSRKEQHVSTAKVVVGSLTDVLVSSVVCQCAIPVTVFSYGKTFSNC